VLSLFISVITASMFEVMELKRIEREVAELMRAASPGEKKRRLLAALHEVTAVSSLRANGTKDTRAAAGVTALTH